MPPRELTGKVIVITGASSGIGAATALACAEAGMDLVLSARRADRLEAVADRGRRLGRQVHTVVGDVTAPRASATLLDAAVAEFDRFDAVFANAGYGLTRRATDGDDAEIRRLFDVNFFASVELLREAARRLLAEGRPGHLLMCASCVSKFAVPRHGAYAASKAAQDSIASAMRLELRPMKIDVSTVHPITTTTEFFDVQGDVSGVNPPAGGTPLHTPGLFVQRPERVARAIVRCLRRPRPAVWTSHTVRIVAGVMVVFPRFGDWVLTRQTRAEMAEEP